MYEDKRYSRRSLLTYALGLSAVRAFAEEPKAEAPAYNQMSDKQEIELGREAAGQIEKEMKLKFIDLPVIQNYVNDLFGRITKTCRRPNLPYSIKIVDTKEINAFALPGGFVYLNRGLLEWARSESEVAGVLSHEIGHVVGRHGANAVARMTAADSLMLEASRVLLGDELPARMLKQLGGPLGFLALLKYSRTQELEADLLGYYNIQRAGWTPQGMVELFRHFGEKSSSMDSLLSITSTHPAPADREGQITAEMKRFPPRAGLAHDSDGFKGIQAELKKLPPPKVRKENAAN